jgi:hypothetical protein
LRRETIAWGKVRYALGFPDAGEEDMTRIAAIIAAALFAPPLVAQERVYVYVKFKDATGTSSRHRLDCIDLQCKLSVKSDERSIVLSADQQRELLSALQAEAKQFVVTPDSASSDQLLKVKFRYDTPTKRLEIERRLPADKPAELAPEMIRIVRTLLDLDLSEPVSPRSASGGEPGGRPGPQGPSK